MSRALLVIDVQNEYFTGALPHNSPGWAFEANLGSDGCGGWARVHNRCAASLSAAGQTVLMKQRRAVAAVVWFALVGLWISKIGVPSGGMGLGWG